MKEARALAVRGRRRAYETMTVAGSCSSRRRACALKDRPPSRMVVSGLARRVLVPVGFGAEPIGDEDRVGRRLVIHDFDDDVTAETGPATDVMDQHKSTA